MATGKPSGLRRRINGSTSLLLCQSGFHGWAHRERFGTTPRGWCIISGMNLKIKLRLAALGLALGLLLVLIVGVTLTSQRETEKARAQPWTKNSPRFS